MPLLSGKNLRMYAFQLGREYKLSIAEIYAMFPTAIPIHIDEKFCILDIDSLDEILKKAKRMGGVIKIIKIQKNVRDVSEMITQNAQNHEGKFRYGLSLFGQGNLKKMLMDQKKDLKTHGVSARFINKNFENLSSAQIIAEDLVTRNSDFNVIQADKNIFVGTTVWVQDINAYSKRDYGKTRDMLVGMLPPKLAQIMINIGTSSSSVGDIQTQTVYDPFCGLGTVLIESMLMGNSEVYGSDISPENIEKTRKNINYTRKNFENTIKTADVSVLDAKGISSSAYLKKSDIIVTEGYLGKAFLPHSVTLGKIQEEKKELLEIYEKFFTGLQKANFRKPLVVSFPFWEIQGKYYYFSEIYDIIKKYGKTLPLLPRMENIKHTKSGSLLYKRPGQVVGREIFKIKIRNL
ncbi:hypothetical protein N9J72_00125 [Candidatus Gracilibacteria bacterium]|nr:hypothetical protein [Candidatus Gracilibacteria bacterium]